jgi:hypothetical protein
MAKQIGREGSDAVSCVVRPRREASYSPIAIAVKRGVGSSAPTRSEITKRLRSNDSSRKFRATLKPAPRRAMCDSIAGRIVRTRGTNISTLA